MIFYFLAKKLHPNTLKSLENFKTPQLKIFLITVNFRVLYKMSSSITLDFKWVFKIHVLITVDLSFWHKSPKTFNWIHPLLHFRWIFQNYKDNVICIYINISMLIDPDKFCLTFHFVIVYKKPSCHNFFSF